MKQWVSIARITKVLSIKIDAKCQFTKGDKMLSKDGITQKTKENKFESELISHLTSENDHY